MSQVRALRALGQPVEEWNAWLVTLLCCRLDATTVGEWQLLQVSKDLLKFGDLERFLANRVLVYEVGEVDNQSTESKPPASGSRSMPKRILFTNQDDNTAFMARKCVLCPDQHSKFMVQ